MIKRNILFICTVNQCRSPTAEWLYGKNDDLVVMSAGVDPRAVNPISRELLAWADQIFVFEGMQARALRKFAPDLYGRLKIHCLYIRDEYSYQDPVLLRILEEKLTTYLGVPQRHAREFFD